MTRIMLKLYVAGQSLRSKRAIANLEQICELGSQEAYETAVVDIVEHPDLAIQQQVLATPTLVRESPTPARRLVGDLSDYETVLRWLET